MKIICFATLKGGSGKTSNAFNIAGVLAENSRVLMVDMDPQSNMTSNFDVDIDDGSIPSIKNIFTRDTLPPESIVLKNRIPLLPNLDLLPSTIEMFEIEDMLITREARAWILARYIKKHLEFFSSYDYVIIDTNPSMSIVNINAFVVADSIILNSDIGWNSLKGARIFRELWERKRRDLELNDNVVALIISNYSGQSNLSKAFLISARSAPRDSGIRDLSDLTCENFISRSDKVKEAEVIHIPVSAMPKKDRAQKKITEQYEKLVQELKEVEVF